MKFLILLFCVFSVSASADLDKDSQKALEQTQQLLKSGNERQDYIKDHPEATAADDKVKAVTNSPENQQAIYDLSAKIFETTTTRTSGDVKQQQELLKNAAQDPAGFIQSLPADQQRALRDLASQIEKQNGAVGAPK